MLSSTLSQTTALGFAIQPATSERRWVDQVAAIFAALMVVVGMYWGGDVAARYMSTSFNYVFGGLLMALGFPDGSETAPDPNFLQAARVNAEFFAYQYGGVVIILLALGLASGRMSFTKLGITRGKYRLSELLSIGIVAGAVASIASTVIFAGKELFPLGDDTPFWWMIGRVDWDLDLWIFMAVGSYALVPLLEEFAYRGGMLGNLARAFAPGAAILGVGILFAVMHSQYWSIGPIGIITLFGVLYSGVIFGYVFLRTGSLLPAIIAHAMINVPVALEYEWLRVGFILAVMLVARKQIGEAFMRICRSFITVDTLRLALLGSLIYVGYWMVTSQFELDRKVIEVSVVIAGIALTLIARYTKPSPDSPQ